MYDAFVQWVKLTISVEKYEFSRGLWLDHPSLADRHIAAVLRQGGARPDVEDRRPSFRVLLLGPREGREHASAIQLDIDALAHAAMSDSVPCGAAAVSALGEPVGPAYTTEGRPWVSLDFEVLY